MEDLFLILIKLYRLDLVRHPELLKEKEDLGKTGPQQRLWMIGSEFTFHGFGPGAGSGPVMY